MADIQIVDAALSPCGQYIYLYRTIDGALNIERMPKEILAIRAAEYNLPADAPEVLDIVLMESVIVEDNPPEIDPLYSKDTIQEALDDLMLRVERTKTLHGAPKEPQMRSLFRAAETGKATPGLSKAKALLVDNADPEIGMWVKVNRDRDRHKLRSTLTFAEQVRETALSTLFTEAKAEDNERNASGRSDRAGQNYPDPS